MSESICDQLKKNESFVAFIDVLGFKEMVKRNDPKIDIFFSVVEQELESFATKLLDIGFSNRNRQFNYIIISDSVILTAPSKPEKLRHVSFGHLIWAIKTIQLQLAKNDIWIRGAISYGPTYFSKAKKQVVGQGFIDAYLLAENVANFPRVIIEPSIVGELGFDSIKEFIFQFNNGFWFTDEDEAGDLVKHNRYRSDLFDWSSLHIGSTSKVPQDIALFIDFLTTLYSVFGEQTYDSSKLVELETTVGYINSNLMISSSTYPKYRFLADYIKEIYYRVGINEDIQRVLARLIDEGDETEAKRLKSLVKRITNL